MLFASGVIVALLFVGTTISMLLPLDGDEELDPISETPPGAPQNDAFDNLDLLDAINATGESLVTGTSGSDLLKGDDANNLISSWGGDDVVLVGKGNDTIYLGRGDDVGFGQGGNDRIQGADGDDIIRGNWGNDTLTGDAGSDYLVGGPGADVLRGGSDEDVLLAMAVRIRSTVARITMRFMGRVEKIRSLETKGMMFCLEAIRKTYCLGAPVRMSWLVVLGQTALMVAAETISSLENAALT